MTVLAVVKQMKGGKNVQFVAEAGGNSPVTFQEFQMQGTPPENRNAAPSAEGKSQVLAISREESAFHNTCRSYRPKPHDVKVSFKLSKELDREDSDGKSPSKSSASEDQGDTPPPENEENAASPAEGDSQVVVPTARPAPEPTPASTFTPTPMSTPVPTTRTISRQEFSHHNTANDLWTELDDQKGRCCSFLVWRPVVGPHFYLGTYVAKASCVWCCAKICKKGQNLTLC
jgi:hypothetical protein